MDIEVSSLGVDADLVRRADIYRALGEPHRLAIVDALQVSDRAPSQLAALTGLSSNLVAFHLKVLEHAGVVERTVSEGDARRRYVRLRAQVGAAVGPLMATEAPMAAGVVVFVCTHNSARSQLAAALWEHRTGQPAWSAGDDPAPRVHPLAVEVARARGLDLSGETPCSFDELDDLRPQLVVSVCDRVAESWLPFDAPTLHWSIADPVGGDRQRFEETYRQLAARIDVLAQRTHTEVA